MNIEERVIVQGIITELQKTFSDSKDYSLRDLNSQVYIFSLSLLKYLQEIASAVTCQLSSQIYLETQQAKAKKR